MCASLQCFNLPNDLATHIHTSLTFFINGLFISAYAISHRSPIAYTQGTSLRYLLIKLKLIEPSRDIFNEQIYFYS